MNAVRQHMAWVRLRLSKSSWRFAAVGIAIATGHSTSIANPGDERCFPLYRQAGAVPRTPQCMIRVQAAATGLGTLYCQQPPPQNRYCEGDEKKFDICPKTPYPISIATGTKTLKESDYGPQDGLLSLTRYYNSSASAIPGGMLGTPWRTVYEASIAAVSSTLILATRPDGSLVEFEVQGTSYVPDPDVKDRLTRTATGWTYQVSTGRLDTFDANGVLKTIETADGYRVDLTYSTASTPATVAPGAGYVIRVQDIFGRGIDFQYNSSGRVATAQPAAGLTYTYSYDDSGVLSDDVLTKVLAPDGAARVYRYGEAAFITDDSSPYYLTGIEDEQGVREANYFYNVNGKAYREQRLASPTHAVDEYNINFIDDETRDVTAPNGAKRTYSFTKMLDLYRMTSSSQPAGSGCLASTRSQGFDTNGNVTSSINFDGYRTCSAFDATRNLETAKVEGLTASASCAAIEPGASVPASSRKISTAWHPDWELVSKRAEPRKITTYVYNGQPDPFAGGTASCANGAILSNGRPIAVLCKQVEQATLDVNGASGLSVSPDATTPARVRQWSYNQNGQVVSEKDALNHQISYGYYSDTTADHTKGDLQTVTNALNQITRFTKYNMAGQWLEMVDANIVTTTRTFDLRQRLKSTTTAGTTFTFDYWPSGLLKRVTRPDTGSLNYGYDDARRLTSISDGLGNSITYTLDDSGNRIAENVTDPSGKLAKTLSRVPDPLQRIQQISGRE